jgi:S1-C subfamily serine protease
MRTLRTFCLIFALLVGFASMAGPAKISNDSVVALRAEDGSIFCSGFVINSEKRYVMTADHCLRVQIQPIMNEKRGWEVFHLPALDVAILQADAVFAVPALKANQEMPKPGDKVVFKGYADGRESVRTLEGKVIMPAFFSRPDQPPYMMWAPAIIPGMSGGPTLDSDGKVVSINSAYVDEGTSLSISRPMWMIYKLTQEFWGPQ